MTELTNAQVHRRKCIRCGDPGHAQWTICADGNQPRVLCRRCDVKLNRMVVKWIGFKHAKGMIAQYKQRVMQSD